MAGSAHQEILFPADKRRHQSTQLMNLLLRAPMAPLIRFLAAIRVSGDGASWVGLAAYFGGAALCVAGDPAARNLGIAIYFFGMACEFVDGGLARLRGPSPIGHFLSKLLESAYVVTLVPALAVGLYRHGDCGLETLLLGLLGSSTHLLFRSAIEAVGQAHPEAELARWADGPLTEVQRYAVAQFLPSHPSFRSRHRLPRIVRENLMESTGIQPLLLLAATLSGRPGWFVLYYGAVQCAAWCGFVTLKLALLRRGGGRLL